MSGTEGAHHFLQVPQIVTKSMEYHYPAEFIVPTNVPFDIGPIGRAFETEFERQEMPIGLQFQDMLQGLLITGGTVQERFHTDVKVVYETAVAEGNYLILTTNKEWRRLLDLIPDACLFRMGDDLTLNPLDPEGADIIEHATILAQAFAQTFYLTRLGYERILELIQSCLMHQTAPPNPNMLKERISNQIQQPRTPAKTELEMIHQFLLNINYGTVSKILGMTMIPFEKLTRGVTILEIDRKGQQQVQFLLLCLLGKLLAYSHSHPSQQCMVLVDAADLLIVQDPNTYRSREIEQYFLDWLKRFKLYGVGVHLSMQFPSRFPHITLNSFQTILAHRTTSYEDVKVVRDLLQFLPDNFVHSRLRHDNYQVEFLKTTPPDTLILKCPNILNAFPIQMPQLNPHATHLWTPKEIQDRLQVIFPGWNQPIHEDRSVIEINFGEKTPIIQRIISLLKDYPELSRQQLLSSLNSDPAIDLDMAELDYLLSRLVGLEYIVPNEWVDRQGHRHRSYELKEKAEAMYLDYLEDLRRRSRAPS